MNNSLNRRSFFQAAGALVGAAVVVPMLARAEGRRGGAKAGGAAALKLVDPKDAQAKAVNYVHVNTEIKDKALMADRVGVKFKDQKCNGCIFYQPAQEATVDGKKAAPCQMPFAAGKVVAAEGWCSSWAKKS